MNKTIITVIAILVLMLFSTIIIYGEEFEPDEYIWIPSITDYKESRYVPVYYFDEQFDCKLDGIYVNGCYMGNIDIIILVEAEQYNWTMMGCTNRDHEFFHAMGYVHGEGPLGYMCPNPNVYVPINYNMSYDENNWKHKDLTIDYKADIEPWPKAKWY